MANTVNVIIKAQGAKEAGDDIKSIGTKAEESSGHLGKLGSALGGIGTIAGGIIAAKGIEELGGAVRDAFGGAISLQKTMAQTDAALASTGGASGMTAKSVRDLANQLESMTAIDDEAIQKSENLLLTFTNIGKDVFPAATEAVLNMSTALGEDANTAAVQLGKALNDPVAGVTALQRVGVKLTDSQKDLVKSLVETGDVAGAQKVILGELNTEFGNSARAAGQTLGGQLSLLKDAFSDAFRDLMVKIIPSLTEFATNVVPLVSEGLGKAVDVLADLASAAADIAAAGWDKVSGPLADLAGIAWDGLQAGAEALASLYEWEFKLAAVAWDKIQGPLSDLTSLSWDGLRAGIDSLRALAESKFDQVAPQFESLSASLKGIDMASFASGWERVKSAIQPVIDVLKPLAEQLLASLKNQFEEVGKALGPLGSALADLAAAFKPLEPLIKPIAEVLGVVIVAAIAALLVQLRLFTEFLTITLVGAIKAATLAIEGIAAVYEKVNGLLAPYVAKFLSIGQDIIGGLLKGAISGGKALWEWLKDVGDSIVRFVGDTGRVLWDAGSKLVEGLFSGIVDKFTSGIGAIKDKLEPRNWDIPGLSPLPLAMEHAGQIAGGKFVGGLHGSLVQGIESVVGSAQDALSGMANVTAAAVPAVGGVVAGIGRGTPEQVAAILKGIGNGTIQDWAADYSKGYMGAATGTMNGPLGSYQQQPSVVPDYVKAWAGRTDQMPVTGALTPQITVHLTVDGQVLATAVVNQPAFGDGIEQHLETQMGYGAQLAGARA